MQGLVQIALCSLYGSSLENQNCQPTVDTQSYVISASINPQVFLSAKIVPQIICVNQTRTTTYVSVNIDPKVVLCIQSGCQNHIVQPKVISKFTCFRHHWRHSRILSVQVDFQVVFFPKLTPASNCSAKLDPTITSSQINVFLQLHCPAKIDRIIIFGSHHCR